jgi:hypothetical protein
MKLDRQNAIKHMKKLIQEEANRTDKNTVEVAEDIQALCTAIIILHVFDNGEDT